MVDVGEGQDMVALQGFAERLEEEAVQKVPVVILSGRAYPPSAGGFLAYERIPIFRSN